VNRRRSSRSRQVNKFLNRSQPRSTTNAKGSALHTGRGDRQIMNLFCLGMHLDDDRCKEPDTWPAQQIPQIPLTDLFVRYHDCRRASYCMRAGYAAPESMKTGIDLWLSPDINTFFRQATRMQHQLLTDFDPISISIERSGLMTRARNVLGALSKVPSSPFAVLFVKIEIYWKWEPPILQVVRSTRTWRIPWTWVRPRG